MHRLCLRYDPATGDADLAPGPDPLGFESEAIAALLSDARVAPSELPEGVPNRGWWAGVFGSRLWLLEQAVLSEEAARQAEAAAVEALSFLLAQRRVRAIAATAEVREGWFDVTVRITPNAGPPVTLGPFRYLALGEGGGGEA